MLDALVLLGALASNTLGLAWFALAMDEHWRQVRGPAKPGRGTVVVLRALGAVALLLSLALCLFSDHASMASLVWVMALAGAAWVIAFTLTWRPRLLAPLVAWVR